LKTIRDFAYERAADGTPADLVPANFRRGVRLAWDAFRQAANEEEQRALMESSDQLFEYIDFVSEIFAEAYSDRTNQDAASNDECQARSLLGRLIRQESLLTEDFEFAERVGFELKGVVRSFVIAWQNPHAAHHAAFASYASYASRLRAAHMIAAYEHKRVVGLSHEAFPWDRLQPDAKAIISEQDVSIHGDLRRTFDELKTVVEIAMNRGHTGVVCLDRYVPELLLRRSPRVADHVHARIYGSLQDCHPHFVRALDLLIENDFDQAATASALPVHRNTLRNWIVRISEITGVDLDHVEGRGLAWLAWVEKNQRAPDYR
jgi:DNA-binding PucR family transcriptional regulator